MSFLDDGVDQVAATAHRFWLDPYSLHAHHPGIVTPIAVGLSHCQAAPPTLLSSSRNGRIDRRGLSRQGGGTGGSSGFGSMVGRTVVSSTLEISPVDVVLLWY